MTYFRLPGLKRIAKATSMTSKGTKAIAVAMIILVVLASVFSLWLSSSVLIPLIASVGGIIVFLGLWIEKEGDEKNEKFGLSFLKPYKDLEELGWWVLMFGIAAEIVTAGFLAGWEEFKDSRNNPLNQPIRSVTASVDVFVEGTNGLSFNFEEPFRASALLSFGSSRHLTIGWPECDLRHCMKQFVLLRDDSGVVSTWWHFDFNQEGILGTSMEPQDNKVAGQANRWDTVSLELLFLPEGTMVTHGTVPLQTE